VAIKQILDTTNSLPEENKLRFEQEIAIMWTISSHPNIITLVGYSENPRCIITKVFFLRFSFSFSFLFLKKNKIKNSYTMKIYTIISKTRARIFQVKLFSSLQKIFHQE